MGFEGFCRSALKSFWIGHWKLDTYQYLIFGVLESFLTKYRESASPVSLVKTHILYVFSPQYLLLVLIPFLKGREKRPFNQQHFPSCRASCVVWLSVLMAQKRSPVAMTRLDFLLRKRETRTVSPLWHLISACMMFLQAAKMWHIQVKACEISEEPQARGQQGPWEPQCFASFQMGGWLLFVWT